MDKDKNYLTGCHPHGVFAIGAFGAFGCDGLEWEKLFPGISRRVCTLAVSMDSVLTNWWLFFVL